VATRVPAATLTLDPAQWTGLSLRISATPDQALWPVAPAGDHTWQPGTVGVRGCRCAFDQRNAGGGLHDDDCGDNTDHNEPVDRGTRIARTRRAMATARFPLCGNSAARVTQQASACQGASLRSAVRYQPRSTVRCACGPQPVNPMDCGTAPKWRAPARKLAFVCRNLGTSFRSRLSMQPRAPRRLPRGMG